MATYRVKKGDNWFNIAERFGASPQDLMRRNGDVRRLRAGQTIDVQNNRAAEAEATELRQEQRRGNMTPARYSPPAPVMAVANAIAPGLAQAGSWLRSALSAIGGSNVNRANFGQIQPGRSVPAYASRGSYSSIQAPSDVLQQRRPGSSGATGLYRGIEPRNVPANVIQARMPTQLPDTYFGGMVKTAEDTAAQLLSGSKPSHISISDQWLLGLTNTDLLSGGYQQEPWMGWTLTGESVGEAAAAGTGAVGGGGSAGTGGSFGGFASGGVASRGPRGITPSGREYFTGIGPISWRV